VQTSQATILFNRPLSSSSWLLRLERGDFQFKPGELITLYGRGQHACRDYSVASGVNDPYIEVLYRLVENGTLTPELIQLKEGQSIEISGPTGRFTVRDTSRPLVFVATGTGIAPFRSYFRSYPELKCTLIHGVRQAEDLYFEAEWASIDYRPCLSTKHSVPPSCYAGRLTRFLPDFDLPDNAQFYLCGANEMIYEVSDQLVQREVDRENIFHEPYYYRWDD